MSTPFPYALDPTANKKPYIYGVSCTVYTLAVASVALRIISRRISRAGFQADDYLIFASLIIDTALFIDIMLLLHDGLGQHLKSLVQYSSFMKVYIFGDVMYTCTLALTKYSILCFYWRIFGHVKKIRWPIYILIGLTTAWLIEVVFISIFECRPIAYSWDLTIKGGHCVDLFKFFLATLIINFATDLAILSLPMPFIWRLQRSTTQKILISSLFLLGSFVCMISIIRLTILLKTDFSSIDETWSAADFTMWCNVEASIAIVSGCLPMLRPVFSASISHISSLYQNSQTSYLRSGNGTSMLGGKNYGIHAAQKRNDVEEDTLPMHIFKVHVEKPVHGRGGSIGMKDEFSIGHEARNQAKT